MATLVFTIGGVSATVTIPNAKATEWVGAFIRSRAIIAEQPVADDDTATKKLTWATRQIAREFRHDAIQQIAREASITAAAATQTEQEATDWT